MALKPLRPCRHPGCAALTREGYCPKHKPQKAPRRVSAEYHSWYSLPIWTDDLRPAQLLREPFCRECAAQYPPGDPRHRTRATVVDHIKPHRGSWPRFIDPANHQRRGKRCQDQNTAREPAEERRKRDRIGGYGWTGSYVRAWMRRRAQRLVRGGKPVAFQTYPHPKKVLRVGAQDRRPPRL